jgi:hypothetical protein
VRTSCHCQRYGHHCKCKCFAHDPSSNLGLTAASCHRTLSSSKHTFARSVARCAHFFEVFSTPPVHGHTRYSFLGARAPYEAGSPHLSEIGWHWISE